MMASDKLARLAWEEEECGTKDPLDRPRFPDRRDSRVCWYGALVPLNEHALKQPHLTSQDLQNRTSTTSYSPEFQEERIACPFASTFTRIQALSTPKVDLISVHPSTFAPHCPALHDDGNHPKNAKGSEMYLGMDS
jgi:hypothetical protein